MTKKEPTLNTLLNDDSYITWLRGDSTSVENKKWRQWYAASETHQELTKKAKKFLNMPFKSIEIDQENIQLEAEKLKRIIAYFMI